MALTLPASLGSVRLQFTTHLFGRLSRMAQKQPPLYSPGREAEVKRATTPRYVLLLHLSQAHVRPIHLHARKRALTQGLE
jgi:hypothetical protein